MPTMTMTQKTYRELEQAAQMSWTTKDVVLQNALSRYLAELQEDAEDAALAEKAWADFEKSGEATIPAEVLYKELGLKWKLNTPQKQVSSFQDLIKQYKLELRNIWVKLPHSIILALAGKLLLQTLRVYGDTA